MKQKTHKTHSKTEKESCDTTIDRVQIQNFFDTERTILSNERTLLSFVRTSLALIATGATFVHFLQRDEWISLLGWFFILLGIVAIVTGIYLYLKVRSEIKRDEKVAHQFVIFDGGD